MRGYVRTATCAAVVLVSLPVLLPTYGSDESSAVPAERSHTEAQNVTLASEDGRPEQGRQVFLDYCSFCHELSGGLDSADAKGLLRTATGEPFTKAELAVILEYPPPGMLKIPLGETQRADLLSYLVAMPQQSLITPNGRP